MPTGAHDAAMRRNGYVRVFCGNRCQKNYIAKTADEQMKRNIEKHEQQ